MEFLGFFRRTPQLLVVCVEVEVQAEDLEFESVDQFGEVDVLPPRQLLQSLLDPLEVLLHDSNVHPPVGFLHRELARNHQILLELSQRALFQHLQSQLLIELVEDFLLLLDEGQDVLVLEAALEHGPVVHSLNCLIGDAFRQGEDPGDCSLEDQEGQAFGVDIVVDFDELFREVA